jgi:hypothetical protein
MAVSHVTSPDASPRASERPHGRASSRPPVPTDRAPAEKKGPGAALLVLVVPVLCCGAFGREAAFNEPVTGPGWERGMASKALSLVYDPAGIPDLYVLIAPTGHIRYRNSVPDSTIGALLAAAKRVDTCAQTKAAVQR